MKLSVTSRFEANGGGQSSFNSPRFTVASSGLSVSLGNICGAIECMPNVYTGGQKSAGIGLSGLGYHNMVINTGPSTNYFNWDAYSSSGQGAAGRNGVEATYAMGDFKAHLSYSDDNATSNSNVAGFVSYTFSGWTAAVGFQDADNNAQDKTIVTLGGAIGDLKVTAGYADNNGVDKFALAGAYNLGNGLSLHGFVASEDGNAPANAAFDGESYGVGVSYNLGAGASIEAGIIQTSNSLVKADLGLHFSF